VEESVITHEHDSTVGREQSLLPQKNFPGHIVQKAKSKIMPQKYSYPYVNGTIFTNQLNKH
jgi:hypothetical protein